MDKHTTDHSAAQGLGSVQVVQDCGGCPSLSLRKAVFCQLVYRGLVYSLGSKSGSSRMIQPCVLLLSPRCQCVVAYSNRYASDVTSFPRFVLSSSFQG